MKKIIVLGGGSAGGMTAYTLKKCFPEKEIVMIKSKDIPAIGVGESTLGHFKQWLSLVDIKDKDFMKECDSVYKLSIRFQDFFKKGDGGYHYPFGVPDFTGNQAWFNDWVFKKTLNPEIPVSDFADSYYPSMSLVKHNTLLDPEVADDYRLGTFSFKNDVAYQINAVKFGLWLCNSFKNKLKGTVIEDTVIDIKTNEDGVEYLQTKDNGKLNADLYIDCSGFKSILLGQSLKEPFESYEDFLPNNAAWATQMPYTNKEKELVNYTNCTAIENGWVWKVPLWSRIGTGYVYSDKYVSDEDALKQFQKHLGRADLNFRNIKSKVGIYNRIYVKNVCAIGLSAGFIEPLESNGLYSVHEFLIKLVRVLKDRDSISNYVKDQFNLSCSRLFREFAEFVAMHYSLSTRTDTEYWKAVQNRNYPLDKNNKKLHSLFEAANLWKFNDYHYPETNGVACISTGMHWFSTDEFSLRYGQRLYDLNSLKEWKKVFSIIDDKKKDWDLKASFGIPFEEFMRLKIHESIELQNSR